MKLIDICREADKIYKEYNPNGLVPFPFEKITEKLDVDIVVSDEMPKGVSGFIGFNDEDESYRIVVNKNKPKTRIYFTIAHELGHYFLHKELIGTKADEVIIDNDYSLDGEHMLYREDGRISTRHEIEANNFAACLIMPEERVISAWEKLKSVEDCARVFRVSVSAMSIRLERLGLLNYD